MAKNFVASFPVMRPSPSENQSIEYHVKESKKGENYQQKKIKIGERLPESA